MLSETRREARYGMPAADQILYNRFYVIGYSYYFGQAKWALEIVGDQKEALGLEQLPIEELNERLDNFREDYRVPEMFRAELKDYRGSGFDRGHLVASANKIGSEIQNSETFLLSNMSPQHPRFNQDIWRALESKVRDLDDRDSVLETYVVSGPLFDYDKPIECVGTDDGNAVTIPIPHYYFKCILVEKLNGRLELYAFKIPNAKQTKPLKDFLVTTAEVEQWASSSFGGNSWERMLRRRTRKHAIFGGYSARVVQPAER